jgi:hypothetical protein
MSRNKNRNKNRNRTSDSRVVDNSENKVKSSRFLPRLFGLRSILLCAGGILLIFASYRHVNGYRWTWDSLLRGNWDLMRKHPDASIEQRYELKLGFLYKYLDYVRKNTPEDAVILFPESAQIREMEKKHRIDTRLTGKLELSYFLYPRKVVMKLEQGINPIYDTYTHVAVVNGYGYGDVNYAVDPKPEFNILKVNPR